MSTLQDEAALSYLHFLPNEMLVKLFERLTLTQRLSLIQAYPKLKDFGQSETLKKRVITTFDAFLNDQELSLVLNQEGTEIELFLDHFLVMPSIGMILNISRLMPNLREITLSKCQLHTVMCSCQLECPSNYHTKASLFWEELTNVEVLNFNRCTLKYAHFEPDMDNLMDWQRWSKFLKHFILKSPSDKLQEVTFCDTFPIVDYWQVMTCIRMGSCSLDQPDIDMSIEVENMNGESLDIAKILYPNMPGGKANIRLWKNTSIVFRLEALHRMIKRPDDILHLAPKRFNKVQVKKGRVIKFVDNFDLDRLRRQLLLASRYIMAN